MIWLAYKVTLFSTSESVAGIAMNETDALIEARKQITVNAVLTGRRTERVALDEKE